MTHESAQHSVNRVLLVDDDPSMTHILATALAGEPYQTRAAWTAEEALRIVAHEDVAVLVTDDRMPGMRGIELLRELRALRRNIYGILLTGAATLEGTMRAVNEADVYRVFTKPCDLDTLRRAIRQALTARSRRTYEQTVLRLAREQRGSGPPTTLALSRLGPAARTLTSRERNVVHCLAREGSVERVAGALHISRHTVRNHLKAVFRKLGVHSQTELMSRLTGVGLASTG